MAAATCNRNIPRHGQTPTPPIARRMPRVSTDGRKRGTTSRCGTMKAAAEITAPRRSPCGQRRDCPRRIQRMAQTARSRAACSGLTLPPRLRRVYPTAQQRHSLSATTATFSAGGRFGRNAAHWHDRLVRDSREASAEATSTNFRPVPGGVVPMVPKRHAHPGGDGTRVTRLRRCSPPNNNDQYSVAIRALGYLTWSNSTPAVLTVITDTNKPTCFCRCV